MIRNVLLSLVLVASVAACSKANQTAPEAAPAPEAAAPEATPAPEAAPAPAPETAPAPTQEAPKTNP